MTFEQFPWEVYRDAHDAALAVNALIPAGADVFRCGWLVEHWTEDGPGARECRAVAWLTDRGWECAHGHEHVDMETRAAEGWDYFDDDEIAAMRNGQWPLPLVEPRHMDGRLVVGR